MSKTNSIDAFLSKLEHPLKAEMEAVIQVIRAAGPNLREDVKWGGPSFDYGEPMATFNPRVTDYVALIFHKGELLNDQTGLLEPGPKGRAYAKFRSMDDVKKHETNLRNIVDDWIKLMDQ